MPPINFAGPPVPRQLFLFFIAAVFFWIYGRFWQYRTRHLYPPDEKPVPRWIRWVCGEFNPNYGMNPYAIFLQVPQVVMSVITYLVYLIVPTAAIFGIFSFVSLLIYLFLFRYLHVKGLLDTD